MKKGWMVVLIFSCLVLSLQVFAQGSDEDSDGVPDDDDKCPGTSALDAPTVVRASAGMDEETKKVLGCPDSDGDGEADSTDLCPQTDPQEMGEMDADGCSCQQKLTSNGCPEGTDLMGNRITFGQGVVCCQEGCRNIDNAAGVPIGTCCSGAGCDPTNPSVPPTQIITPPAPERNQCPSETSVTSDPSAVPQSLLFSVCCPEKISLEPRLIHIGDAVRFGLGCFEMEASDLRFPSLDQQSELTRASYALDSPPNHLEFNPLSPLYEFLCDNPLFCDITPGCECGQGYVGWPSRAPPQAPSVPVVQPSMAPPPQPVLQLPSSLTPAPMPAPSPLPAPTPVPSCTPVTEVCDRVDNDCDGFTDEGGVCTVTVIPTCTPSSEICDSKDNDCDGLTDEDNVCCKPSTEVCDKVDNDCDGLADEGGVCITCTPSREICDKKDNDCNGLTDENNVCCKVSLEVCDGIDNDCNGKIDENAVAEFCDKVDNDCNGKIDDITEVCDDKVDNDCDGSVDEGCYVCKQTNPIEICSNGRDENCAGGVDEIGCCTFTGDELCRDRRDNNCNGAIDEAGCVCVQTNGGTEICGDGIDNDCNGLVDISCCSPGIELCTDGMDSDCDGSASRSEPGCCTPVAEVCTDSIDNDCDGMVNDGCSPPCILNTKVIISTGGREESYVACHNGRDDDCDGKTDYDDLSCVA